ncbi:MAG: thioredoxin family protein, partial [Anaerolineales bacterium]|nr:thioredoxin family protein [Anaerolineales bacterium]
MITKYSKRSCRDYISLVAFGLVLSFTANLCADSTASSTQPAKKKAPDNSTKSVKVNIISTKVNSTPVKVAGTTTKVNSTPAKATGTTTTVNSTPTDPNSAPAEVKEVVIEEDWKFEWFTDLNKALEIARKRNRSIMLVFGGSDWCVWCQKLDGEVFQKKEFRDYAREHVVSVMLDTPKNMLSSRPHKVFMDKYGVTGYPTVILMDKYGEMLGKGGYLAGGPAPFIEFLAGLIIMPQEKVSSKPLKFDRSPDAVLKALQKQMELRGSKEIISEDNKFIMNVTLGNWRDVKVYLQALPEKDAKKLYYQLL